jgi:hypothetical protein
MKSLRFIKIALLCAVVLLGTVTLKAAEVKTYQVTGPVVELTPTSIVVQKGEDKWEIARNKSTKISGDLKVGAKVTIQYSMVAAEIEVKSAKAKK